MNSVQLLTVLLPTAYLLTAGLYGMAFAGDRMPRWAGITRRIALACTLVLHGSMFALHGLTTDAFPIHGSGLTLSSVVLATALVFQLVSWRISHPAAGSVLLVGLFALQLLASILSPMVATGRAVATDGIAASHILSMTFASAALLLSGVYAGLHVLVFRQMRARRFGPLFEELPDLDALAKLTRRSALAGFLALTVGLNVGIGLAHARREDFGYVDAQVISILVLWVHFGLIAFSRLLPGFTARRVSMAAMCGLAVLIVAFAFMILPDLSFHDLS
tara:strand:+ start:8155 stop:8982 length:828 start_codon:yes stop_codon:yes gene_type:complete